MELSIVTPAYNAEKFIEAMIVSVMWQPMAAELIIVDDGSTDRTAEIVRGYAAANPNIHLIQTENRGAGAARNTGIKAASADWLIFLDADDMLLPNSLCSDFFETLHKYDRNEIDVIYTTRSKTNMDLTSLIQITYPEDILQIKNHMPMNEFWTCIFRRSYLLESNVFFSEYKEQDIETAYRFKAFSRTEHIVSDSNIRFYLQRINPVSNIHTWNTLKMYYIKTRVYYDLLTETIKKPFFATDKDIAHLKYMVFHCLYHYFKTVRVDGYDSLLPESQLYDMVAVWERSGLHLKDVLNLSFHDAALYCIRKIDSIKYGIQKPNYIGRIKKVDCNNRADKNIVFPNNNSVIDRWLNLTSVQYDKEANYGH